ncbi:MAG: 3'-5' exonuclease [Anaerolineaceae bacterium]|nr:3'-5' exonuclease [Anaerolineaceae bacterium]
MTFFNPRQEEIAQIARQKIAQKPIYLDTETTGLTRSDEIVEISVIDYDGSVLFSQLIKPSQPIPKEAERIHGITNAMVANAQSWPLVWTQLRPIVYGRLIGVYNQEFDSRMMVQSHQRYRLPWREKLEFVDVLKLFSEFRGEYDPIHSSYRLFKLAEAGQFFNISLPNAHRSTADALLTRAVLHSIAGLPH